MDVGADHEVVDEREAELGSLGRRLGAVRQFDYLSTGATLAGTYRAIMSVFLANRDAFGLGLSTEDVLARLRSSGLAFDAQNVERLEGHLERLEETGNVHRSQDTSLARTISELARRRSLWRITEEGRLAEQAGTRGRGGVQGAGWPALERSVCASRTPK